MTPPSPPGLRGPQPPMLDRIQSPEFRGRIAIADEAGNWTYGELHAAEKLVARRFGDAAGDLAGERVAYLAPPGRTHVAMQLATWRAGGTAVPLALSHPQRELEHVLDDARPRLVVADPALPRADVVARAARDRGAAALLLREDEVDAAARARSPVPNQKPAPGGAAPRGPPDQRRPARSFNSGADSGGGAFIVYTSGTTGRPKGVLLGHAQLAAQVRSLVQAWEWSAGDRLFHVLPLHHVHGLVAALCCALWSGAACEFAPARARPADIWERWASGGVTLFMAVPTVYERLAREWEQARAPVQRRWSRGGGRLRLMVSGSAALPVSLFARWRAATGHQLLERYGMTETGMTLSNPLGGPRRPGHVGGPLPGVEARIVGLGGAAVRDGEAGELEVRGAQVFAEYWKRPGETAAAFRDGWFRTGDLARVQDGSHRILGRRGTDIFNTGGYRVSALEVEELYRAHPSVRDIAVAGVPDPEWGDRLCAAYVPAGGRRATNDELRAWGKERLAPYKVPRAFAPVDQLPRTAMGKVRRSDVARVFGNNEDGAPPPQPSPRAAGPAPPTAAAKRETA